MENPFRDDGVSDADLEAELKSEHVLKGKIALAEKAKEYWQRIAPVDTGEYRDSIKVSVNGDDVSVGSDDDKASIIEYGSEDTPEFAPRAQVQAKFRLTE